MKSIIVLFLVSVYFASSFADHVKQAKPKPFKFEKCVKGHSIANITRFEILSSYPISLSENITASVDIHLLEDIPDNAFMKTNVYKITSLLGVKLRAPCLFGVGSCTTEYCKFLDRFKDQACPFFQPNVPCDCPIKTGYFGGESITVPVPQLGALLKFIASGDFEIEMKLVVKEKYKERMVACYRFTGTAVP